MAGVCSICGGPTRFNTFKCRTCKKAPEPSPASPPAALEDLPESLSVSSSARFRVERIEAPSLVLSVMDTLTGTIREVTSDPLDALDIAARLNDGFVHARGARWRAPESEGNDA